MTQQTETTLGYSTSYTLHYTHNTAKSQHRKRFAVWFVCSYSFITYVFCNSLAWFGFCTAADRNRLDSFLRRCVKLGFWSSNNTPCISTIAEHTEDTLFDKITHNQYHILQSYLPDRPDIDYNLREPHHNKTLILKTAQT